MKPAQCVLMASDLRGRASLLSLMPYTKSKAVLENHSGSEGRRSHHEISSKCVSRQGHGDEMGSQCLGSFSLVFVHPSEFPTSNGPFTA